MKTYPKPMFDFNERRGICIEGMKNAYRVHLHGDDKKVKDGSWRSLFEDSAEGPTAGKKGFTEGPVKDLDDEDIYGHIHEELAHVGENEALDEGAKGGKEGKGKDIGVDENEEEAKELGGETKGGDHQTLKKEKSPAKGKSPAKKRGQATLDGLVERSPKKGKK